MAERASRQERSGNSKELILKAALRLAVERGYAGTTMADVSAASGLPIGSVYWHFKSKEQLFVALLEHSYEQWQKIYTDEVGLRAKVTRGILGVGGANPDEYTDEEAFLKVAQILALDKRLGGLGADSPVTRAYIDVREKMFQMNVRRVAASLPPEVAAAHPGLAQQLTVLGLAITDGLYVHANSEARHLDFVVYAEVAARALEALVGQYTESAGAAN